MTFPSVSEGFPSVVLEAMMCRATIAAADVGRVAALGNCGVAGDGKVTGSFKCDLPGTPAVSRSWVHG